MFILLDAERFASVGDEEKQKLMKNLETLVPQNGDPDLTQRWAEFKQTVESGFGHPLWMFLEDIVDVRKIL